MILRDKSITAIDNKIMDTLCINVTGTLGTFIDFSSKNIYSLKGEGAIPHRPNRPYLRYVSRAIIPAIRVPIPTSRFAITPIHSRISWVVSLFSLFFQSVNNVKRIFTFGQLPPA